MCREFYMSISYLLHFLHSSLSISPSFYIYLIQVSVHFTKSFFLFHNPSASFVPSLFYFYLSLSSTLSLAVCVFFSLSTHTVVHLMISLFGQSHTQEKTILLFSYGKLAGLRLQLTLLRTLAERTKVADYERYDPGTSIINNLEIWSADKIRRSIIASFLKYGFLRNFVTKCILRRFRTEAQTVLSKHLNVKDLRE